MICSSCANAADHGNLGEIAHMASGCDGSCDCQHRSLSSLRVKHDILPLEAHKSDNTIQDDK